MMKPGLLPVLVSVVLACGFALTAGPASQRYTVLQHEAIRYYSTALTDPIARLQERVDRREVQIAAGGKNGYLASLLEALEIDPSSQILVASKTSLQLSQISPQTPRAIYFNDSVFVGWVQGSDIIEISSVDPQLGAVFYSFVPEEGEPLHFERETDICLQCHNPESPSHVMTSVVPDQDGHPLFNAGFFNTSDQSPLEERWGGWYVTGTHGGQVHMGNIIVDAPPSEPGISTREVNVDRAEGANVVDLRQYVDTEPYLTPYSDIVALMVLGHQIHVQNQVTHLNYETRKTLYEDGVPPSELHNADPAGVSATSRERIEAAVEPLVEAMLFVEEVELTAPIDGTSGYTDWFQSRGPWDGQGRSLRQLDLEHRLFRYPLSYLIYSEAVLALPDIARDALYARLLEVLEDRDAGPAFEHLSAADREAILGILQATHTELSARITPR